MVEPVSHTLIRAKRNITARLDALVHITSGDYATKTLLVYIYKGSIGRTVLFM